MSNVKRLKVSNPIKWIPILADEYINKTFTFKTYIKASIEDNKKISLLVEDLQRIYPLNDSKFKRVKKLAIPNEKVNKFEILLTQKELYTGVPDSYASCLSNISEIELPVDRILTKEQFNLVSKYWPISFHMSKYIESLLDGSFMNDHDLVFKSDLYTKACLNLAKFFKSKSAAIIVDSKTDSIIASGIDKTNEHSLHHSMMVTLDNVAKRQLKEIPKPDFFPDQLDDTEPVNYLKQFIESEPDTIQHENIKLNLSKPLTQNDYLCTSFTAYLTHEPCSMCAMALIHSRIAKVFYVFDKPTGYLNSNCKLHCLPNLNHNYEVFKAKEPLDLDSNLIEYFNKS